MQSSNARARQPHTEPHRNRRHDIAAMRQRQQARPVPRKKPAKKPDEFARLRKNMPHVTKKGNVFYVLDNTKGQYKIPRPLIISIAIIFICAIVSVSTQVYLSSMERQISNANAQLVRIGESNQALLSQIGVHYTDDRIEEIAITQLGMIFPDQSQIIEIYVPRISNVEFNTDQHFLPTENYFWRDIRTFLGGMLDRIFGG